MPRSRLDYCNGIYYNIAWVPRSAPWLDLSSARNRTFAICHMPRNMCCGQSANSCTHGIFFGTRCVNHLACSMVQKSWSASARTWFTCYKTCPKDDVARPIQHVLTVNDHILTTHNWHCTVHSVLRSTNGQWVKKQKRLAIYNTLYNQNTMSAVTATKHVWGDASMSCGPDLMLALF